MAKWEYTVVEIGFSTGPRPHRTNGTDVANWQSGQRIWEYLNSMGASGWELVSCDMGQAGGTGWLVLKRDSDAVPASSTPHSMQPAGALGNV